MNFFDTSRLHKQKIFQSLRFQLNILFEWKTSDIFFFLFFLLSRVPFMFVESSLPLERWSLEIANRVVLTGDHTTKRPRRLEVDRVDWLRGTHDLANTCARIGREYVTEFLATLATNHQTLTVTRPLQIFHTTYK